MAEILVRAVSNSNLDPDKDRMCYKRGHPVVVMEDGHAWEKQKELPGFVVIYIPLIAKAKVLKYRRELMDIFNPTQPYIRRIWRIRWADLPVAAQNRLKNDSELIIKASPSYTGPYDYTWAQVKAFFHNDETDTDESEDL